MKHGHKTINPLTFLRYRTTPGFHEHEQNTNMQSCDDYIKCKVSLVLLLQLETRVQGNQEYSLRVYESDVKEWLPRWPESLKEAVKYEGYLRRKSVY